MKIVIISLTKPIRYRKMFENFKASNLNMNIMDQIRVIKTGNEKCYYKSSLIIPLTFSALFIIMK